MNFERIVIWFSAGVTSALAAKMTADRYEGENLKLVTCDTGSEDEDNYRFMDDVSEWVGLPLEVLKSPVYQNTFDVYHRTGFFKNRYGARCSLELKRRVRESYQQPGDVHVFGFDAGERTRAQRFRERNPELALWFPLVEASVDKMAARAKLLSAGITEPRTYAEGFTNANCLSAGCVKGGIGYWNHLRKMRPLVFERMARMEREIGYALLAHESVGPNGERVKTPVYLDELNPSVGNYRSEPAIQCNLFCEIGNDWK